MIEFELIMMGRRGAGTAPVGFAGPVTAATTSPAVADTRGQCTRRREVLVARRGTGGGSVSAPGVGCSRRELSGAVQRVGRTREDALWETSDPWAAAVLARRPTIAVFLTMDVMATLHQVLGGARWQLMQSHLFRACAAPVDASWWERTGWSTDAHQEPHTDRETRAPTAGNCLFWMCRTEGLTGYIRCMCVKEGFSPLRWLCVEMGQTQPGHSKDGLTTQYEATASTLTRSNSAAVLLPPPPPPPLWCGAVGRER